MIKYDVKATADELMLNVEELKEVFDLYFDEATNILSVCKTSANQQEYAEMAKALHSLKGSSNNLRLTEIAELAASLENLIVTGDQTQIKQRLDSLFAKITMMKEHISDYYRHNI